MSSSKQWIIGFFILVATSFFMLFGWLQTSLPQTEGEIKVAGLKSTVTISRDQNGVPHIRGKSIEDISLGLGFAHAQDRLWQMEINRRLGAGRMAEIFGESVVPIDKFFRTLGFKNKATIAYKALPSSSKSILIAYAEGVNAYHLFEV